jgi:hypothetical protein
MSNGTQLDKSEDLNDENRDVVSPISPISEKDNPIGKTEIETEAAALEPENIKEMSQEIQKDAE